MGERPGAQPTSIDKLRQLEGFMPQEPGFPLADDILCEFGRFLAGRISPDITAQDFVSEGFRAAADFPHEARERVRRELEDVQELMSSILPIFIPAIARAACPENFAKEVEEIYQQRVTGGQIGEE